MQGRRHTAIRSMVHEQRWRGDLVHHHRPERCPFAVRHRNRRGECNTGKLLSQATRRIGSGHGAAACADHKDRDIEFRL